MATEAMHPLVAGQISRRPYGAAAVQEWKPRKPLWWRIARWPLVFGFAFSLLFVLAAPLTYG